jgi:hypothetical protein
MDCLSIRDRLAEFALSGLFPEERARVERHLEWCAGCRKEAGGMIRAATGIGLSLEQEEPSAGLEDRVVETVAVAAGRRPPRRRRVAAAVAVAAGITAVAAIGWGGIMTARAERAESQNEQARQAANEARQQALRITEQLQRIAAELRVPAEAVRQIQLAPTPGRLGGGAALVVDASNQHYAVVIVGGLSERSAPYRATLVTQTGERLLVGNITADRLDRSGGDTLLGNFDRSLSKVRRIEVTSATGAVVLVGTLLP